MIELDHIVVIAPSLEAGIRHVEDALGVAPRIGGKHVTMGTHNAVLRLGAGVYLEVIAIDPQGPAPDGRRWFGLSDNDVVKRRWRDGLALRAWVARCDDLGDRLAAQHGTFGYAQDFVRDRWRWQFGIRPDGELPLGGAMPHLIQWGDSGSPVAAMPDQGCSLLDLVLEAPAAGVVDRVLREKMGLPGFPRVREAARTRLIAAIETPKGVRILT